MLKLEYYNISGIKMCLHCLYHGCLLDNRGVADCSDVITSYHSDTIGWTWECKVRIFTLFDRKL